MARVSQQRRINKDTLRNWVDRVEIDTGLKPGVTRPSASDTTDRSAASTTSRSRPCPGPTGSTPTDCTAVSATSRPSSTSRTTTVSQPPSPRTTRHLPASTEPGATQTSFSSLAASRTPRFSARGAGVDCAGSPGPRSCHRVAPPCPVTASSDVRASRVVRALQRRAVVDVPRVAVVVRTMNVHSQGRLLSSCPSAAPQLVQPEPSPGSVTGRSAVSSRRARSRTRAPWEARSGPLYRPSGLPARARRRGRWRRAPRTGRQLAPQRTRVVGGDPRQASRAAGRPRTHHSSTRRLDGTSRIATAAVARHRTPSAGRSRHRPFPRRRARRRLLSRSRVGVGPDLHASPARSRWSRLDRRASSKVGPAQRLPSRRPMV
jgi:hypothetical protein